MRCPWCHHITNRERHTCPSCGQDLSLVSELPPSALDLPNRSEPLGPLADLELDHAHATAAAAATPPPLAEPIAAGSSLNAVRSSLPLFPGAGAAAQAVAVGRARSTRPLVGAQADATGAKAPDRGGPVQCGGARARIRDRGRRGRRSRRAPEPERRRRVRGSRGSTCGRGGLRPAAARRRRRHGGRTHGSTHRVRARGSRRAPADPACGVPAAARRRVRGCAHGARWSDDWQDGDGGSGCSG